MKADVFTIPSREKKMMVRRSTGCGYACNRAAASVGGPPGGVGRQYRREGGGHRGPVRPADDVLGLAHVAVPRVQERRDDDPLVERPLEDLRRIVDEQPD